MNKKLIPAVCAALLTMLWLMAFPTQTINAQETQNGMESRTPRKMTERMAAASLWDLFP